ncbi:MAG: diguanylate cyclase [Azoarcus sp.]|jgi:diguanylate cyclase (GGDEF)-like protein|nr:diguanylate cyclase [Azoarcus sp.]
MSAPIDFNRFAQIKATGHLPSPRGVALSILRMAQDESVSAEELAHVIKGDPAFVGRLVKAANGVLIRQRPIVSVREALMVLGITSVRAMALGFSLLSNYRKGNCPGFDYRQFWSSSLIMAISMQMLARYIQQVAADELFSVGLLARVGELALATAYPAKYGRILTEAKAGEGDLITLERSTLATSHSELGHAMLTDWGIPTVFTDPVFYFEQPAGAPFAAGEREMLVMQSLILARNVADICLEPPVGQQQERMDRAVRQAARLGCGRENFIEDCGEIARQWADWSKLLQLDSVTPPSFGMLTGVQANDSSPPSRASAPEAKKSAPAPPDADLRAMLVARNSAERMRLAKAVKGMGIAVSELSGLGSIMERVLDVQPHLLILDVDEDRGYASQLIRALRASRLGRCIYILLLLPADDEAHIAVFESGADDFLISPVSMRMLVARLGAAQRIVRLQQELEHEREELRHYAAELMISNRCLQEAALTDALTGLPNRRYARGRMQQEWLTAMRNARTLGVLVVDIDGFKHVNDRYGHDVGDIALRQAADTLRRALRGQDVICRTGGDEFLVICPSATLAEALACAERLCERIRTLEILNEDQILHLTISVGVAVRDASMADAVELVKRADHAVLQAKQQGRNKVVAAHVFQ